MMIPSRYGVPVPITAKTVSGPPVTQVRAVLIVQKGVPMEPFPGQAEELLT
jgi:hypothetical protein